MSYEVPGFKLGTLTAAADLSAKQFTAAKVTAPNTVNNTTAATDLVLGIIQNKPKLGEAVELDCSGVSKVRSGAAVAAGVSLVSDAQGRGITAATPATDRPFGIALETCTAADQIIAVKLTPRS